MVHTKILSALSRAVVLASIVLIRPSFTGGLIFRREPTSLWLASSSFSDHFSISAITYGSRPNPRSEHQNGQFNVSFWCVTSTETGTSLLKAFGKPFPVTGGSHRTNSPAGLHVARNIRCNRTLIAVSSQRSIASFRLLFLAHASHFSLHSSQRRSCDFFWPWRASRRLNGMHTMKRTS